MDVWCMGSAAIQKCYFPGPDFKQVIEGLIEKCSADELVQVAGLARRLWLRRNEVVFGGRMSSPQDLVQATQRAIDDFQFAQGRREMSEVPTVMQNLSLWTAPSPGWVKANWDASLDQKTGRTGLAVVIRDHQGTMLAARGLTWMGCLSPAAAEATTAVMAVQLCKGMGFYQAHFEGDAKAFVDAVTCGESDWGGVGHVVEDFKLEAQSLYNWKISYVQRDGNKVAHLLATYAKIYVIDSLWLEPPDCIRDCILLEQIAPAT